MPFQPKGESAQWRIVYRMFQKADVSAVISYETLAEALHVNATAHRSRIQAVARQAAQHLLVQDNRTIEAVPDKGYRVVAASRQIAMAGTQVERAVSSLDKSRDLVIHVRSEDLDEVQVRRAQAMALMISQSMEWVRQINQRVDDHDGALADHANRFTTHDGRLTDIERELERLREGREGRTEQS